MYLADITHSTEIKKGAIVVQKSTNSWCQIGNSLADEEFELRPKNKDKFAYDGDLFTASLNTLITDYQIAVT
jgi:hypothetical protein